MKGERLGEFEELILLCVRQLGEDAYGASIQEMLRVSAGRDVTLGAIYAALDRTLRKGLATSWMGESSPVRGGRAKRHYALTPAGEDALIETRLVRELLWSSPATARP